MTPEEKLNKCYESFKSKVDFKPLVGLILGSGLGALADEIDVKHTLNYEEIEGFPLSTVPGHKGRFVFGCIEDVPVVIMQGRVHYYEGYQMQDVVLPTRLMRKMGAEVLFLTNASGAANPDYSAGDFMLISDQISDFVPSPLIGANFDSLGVRFPDMSDIYSKELREIVKATANELGIKLREGVYIQLTGPNFESPAEVRMCRLLGADAIGMSTACEAIAANHAGMKTVGISCVANLGCGLTDTPLTHKEVIEAADKAAPLFKKLIKASVVNIAKKLK
ncbi:MAG: purine-nucleoside phosphorylase [Firmicutes bacterium]|nr:purine-nucleoside phosphorylase [[Eubacterium] siraeum]MCM1487443.1 purine-nucleoside phosphorylase [Bacillota bacterium]